MKIDKLREEFEPGLDAHSSWLALKEEEIILSDDNYMCYAPLFCSEEYDIDKLFIFFGENKKKLPRRKEWCHWVINDSFYSEAFVTKDVEEGFNKGFEINLDCEFILMKAGMMCLRNAFEYEGWSWHKFKEIGFDGYQSYALAVNLTVNDNSIYTSFLSNNHLPVYKWQDLNLYYGSGYSPSDYKASKNGMYKSISISSAMGCVNNNKYDYFPTIFGVKQPKFTKENLEKFIKHLKG